MAGQNRVPKMDQDTPPMDKRIELAWWIVSNSHYAQRLGPLLIAGIPIPEAARLESLSRRLAARKIRRFFHNTLLSKDLKYLFWNAFEPWRSRQYRRDRVNRATRPLRLNLVM